MPSIQGGQYPGPGVTRAQCAACGWKGERRFKKREALKDAVAHEKSAHGGYARKGTIYVAENVSNQND